MFKNLKNSKFLAYDNIISRIVNSDFGERIYVATWIRGKLKSFVRGRPASGG